MLFAPVLGSFGLSSRLREATPRLSMTAGRRYHDYGHRDKGDRAAVVVTTLSVEGYPEIPSDAPTWTVFATLSTFLTLALDFLSPGLTVRQTADVSVTISGL